ncbi:hypothetical protein [Curvibacter sp. PAE-UM]|uniref:hypothetical protein n=1 Tax=Curvibacter sp. PAE-UM TaxID=1714344 RepID=UPI0009E7A06E|nr:hypothetical protein [Curvibacter sp. PAE-UM]
MPAPVSSPATPTRGKTRTTTAKKAAPRKAATGKTAVKTGTAQPVKQVKPKKPKLVRDSFTIPKDEYGVLAELKQRCAKLAQPSKKSELLRAGIQALAAMSDKSLLAALKAIPSIKTGRPKKA